MLQSEVQYPSYWKLVVIGSFSNAYVVSRGDWCSVVISVTSLL